MPPSPFVALVRGSSTASAPDLLLRRALGAVTSRPTTFTFANHKGGCAKTTSAANLAAAFAERGRRVLAIDADPQANLSEAFGITTRTGPRLEDRLILANPTPAAAIVSDLPGAVDVLPCSERLEEAVTAHARQPQFAFRMSQLIDSAGPSYDIVIVDTPPGLGPLSSMAMLASDHVVVPARPADLDVMGAMKIARLIRTSLRQANPRLRLLGVLLTQVDHRWRLTTDARAALDRAGVRRLRVEVPARVHVGAAPRYGAPTFVLQPDGMVAEAYRQLAADLNALTFSA